MTKKSKWGRVWQAMQKLRADKEDTTQVFIILNALGEGAYARRFKRFMRHANAATILNAKRPLIDYLRDSDWLAAQAEGSLARHYAAFIAREKISADGLAAASEEGALEVHDVSPAQTLFGQRQRDAHDLWHVATGYGRDALGELALLAVIWRQLGNVGILVIIGVGVWGMRPHLGLRSLWRVLREGFVLGRTASWLPAADWEYLLTRPLTEVRAVLRLAKPQSYRTVLAQNAELLMLEAMPPTTLAAE